MKYFNVFVKTDCDFCKRAVSLLIENNKQFIVTVMDHCEDFRNKIAETTGHKTVPVVLEILEDGTPTLIGGCDNLESLLQKEKEQQNAASKEE